MKPALLLAALVLAVVASLHAQAPAARAEAVTTTIPLAGETVNPCSGEVVTYTGSLHLVMSFTADGSGGFHTVIRSNYEISGVSVTVTVTGTKYRGSGGDLTEENVRPPYPYEFTKALKFVLVSASPTDNFQMHTLFHITFNANGVQTAFVDKPVAECRG